MIKADKEGKSKLDELFGVAQKVINLDSLGDLVALRDSIKLIERPEGDIDG